MSAALGWGTNGWSSQPLSNLAGAGIARSEPAADAAAAAEVCSKMRQIRQTRQVSEESKAITVRQGSVAQRTDAKLVHTCWTHHAQ